MKAIPRGLAVSLPRFVVIAVLLGGLPAQDARVVPASAGSSVPPRKEPRSVPDPEHMTRPKYPKESLQAGVEGAVELRAIVDPNGRTQGLTVVNGKPVFAMPALEAVRKWHFHPVVVEGKPVETTYKIRVRFVLLFQEAVPDWEIESPHETAAIVNSALTNLKRDTPDGPVYRVSESQGVVAPKQVYAPEPEFSEKARKAKEQGTVTLSLIVGTDGKPRDVWVSCSSAPGLNKNALEAAKSWKFEPGTKDGKPVMVEIAVEIQFHLGDN
jgi:TonB family protein